MGHRRRRTTPVALLLAILRAWRALRGITRRACVWRVAHGLLLLLRIAWRARVDGWQRARRPSMLLLLLLLMRRTQPARPWGSVCVRGRAAQGVLGVHGE